MKEKTQISTDKRLWSPSPLVGQLVLVTTLNADGQSNLAPKSWISMMAFDPPLIALGCNLAHWTAQNILRTGEFVVNILGAELVERAWHLYELPHPRPIESAGLTSRPAQKVSPPLIEECKAHLECRGSRHMTFGSEVIFLGEIVAASVDQAAWDSGDPYGYLRLPVFLENGKYGVVERGLAVDREAET